MTSRDFCYWLQGYIEIGGVEKKKGYKPLYKSLSYQQMECIKKHLEMVFKHENDPSYGDKKQQYELNPTHIYGVGPDGNLTVGC